MPFSVPTLKLSHSFSVYFRQRIAQAPAELVHVSENVNHFKAVKKGFPLMHKISHYIDLGERVLYLNGYDYDHI